jgi:hypothetical protein
VEYFVYKDHIPVDDLGITAKEHDQYKFSIWYKNRNLKSYKLENTDAAVRNAWVEEITSLLWEQAMQKKGKIEYNNDIGFIVVNLMISWYISVLIQSNPFFCKELWYTQNFSSILHAHSPVSCKG